jgi:hypothetical protein
MYRSKTAANYQARSVGTLKSKEAPLRDLNIQNSFDNLGPDEDAGVVDLDTLKKKSLVYSLRIGRIRNSPETC